MKKLSFFLMAMLFSVMSFAAETVAYTLTPAATGANSSPHNAYASAADWTYEGITWNVTGNSYMVPWRIGGKSLTNIDRAVYTKTALAADVTKIEITHGTVNCTLNSCTLIVSDAANGAGETFAVTVAQNTTSTITLPEGDYSNKYYKLVYNITVSGTSNKYVQLSEIKFYTEVQTSIEAPTFTPEEGKVAANNTFAEPFALTIASATEGATIKYTLDGTDPALETALTYEAPITISTMVQVRAIAVKGEESSVEATATYIVASTEEKPYTASEAITAQSLGLAASVYVTGTVKSIEEISTQYGNATYNITDGVKELKIYRGKNLENAKFTSADQLLVGDVVVVKGDLTSYNGAAQLAQNNYLISRVTAPTTYTVTATVNSAETGTVEGAGEYEEGAEATLTATAAEGYEFTCWTSGEDTVSTANPYTFAVTANLALVANFNKKAEPEHTYTVAGSSATVFGTAWNAEDTTNNMTKQEDGTYKLEKTELTLAAGTIEFKVVEDHNWNVAYPADNYKLTIAEDGIYTITITFNPADKAVAATATKTGDAGKIIPVIAMHGNFLGSWADTENFTLAADEATATLTLTIAEGNYEFGVRIDGTWTSNGVAFTRENASAEIVAGSGNLTLAADVAGEYTFTWTFETNTLTVTYPALVTAIEVNVTDATATSGEWSIDLAGSWNDQALTIKLWQDNTQGFGSYAPNTETGYYILLGAKELTPTTAGVYADNGDGTFTFTCSATEGTTQYNITVTGTSGAQEVYYETFVLTNLEVTNNETFLVLSASDMNMGLEVTLGVNMDGTLMDASQILFGEAALPIVSSEPVTVEFNEEVQTEVYTARVVVEHMGGQLGLELIMYAGGATSEPIAVNIMGATAAVDEATDVLKITGDWDGIAFELRINAYDPAQTIYDAPQIAEFETEEVYATSSFVTVIKTGENIDVIGEFMSPMGDIYSVYVNAKFAAGPETGVDNIQVENTTVKVVEDGKVFIIRNGVKFNANGAVVK